MNIELLEQIEDNGSRITKEHLLGQVDEQTKSFIKLALDPDVTFGVTVDEDEIHDRWLRATRTMAWPTDPEIARWWEEFGVALDLLKDRRLTGNAAKSAVEIKIDAAPTERDAKWACRILNRNLRLGVDIRTANAVWGEGTVEKFGVQLAVAYELHEMFGLWFFQPKLDGNRVVFIDEQAISRNGKVYPNCEHVVEEIKRKDPDFFKKWVLDGEMMGDLGFDQSSGALRRINEKNREKATFTYWAFDLIDRQEWETRKTRDLFHRDEDLLSVVKPMGLETVKIVPTYRVKNPTHKQAMEFCEEFMKNGFEGAMAKDSSAAYTFKKNDAMLKIKKFYEDEFKVVGFYEGKGKYKKTLGGVFVEGDIRWGHAGQEQKEYHIKCKCGSGFDDATRDLVWRDQKGWLGAVVQVQFQEATVKGSLRFPTFIMRRKDKE